MGLASVGAPSSGGGYAIAIDPGGRQQRVAAGPSGGSVRPVVGYELCRRESACQGDYSYPGERNVQPGQLVRASLARGDTGLVVAIDGLPPQVTPHQGAIDTFRFFVYGEPGSDFDVVIDNVEIRR